MRDQDFITAASGIHKPLVLDFLTACGPIVELLIRFNQLEAPLPCGRRGC